MIRKFMRYELASYLITNSLEYFNKQLSEWHEAK